MRIAFFGVTDVALGIATEFRTFVLPGVSTANFERVGINLHFSRQGRPWRTVLSLRFVVEVPEIELVAVDAGSFIPVQLRVDRSPPTISAA